MARRVAEKVTVAAELVARSPLAVGGMEGDTDLPLAVDGRGDPHVPGTSLAGPLRHWAARNTTDPALVDRVFGPPMERGGSDGHAAWLTVLDGAVRLPPEARIERRDGVGIDRVWGVAAHHAKYERLVLPRGTRVALRLLLDLPPATEAAPKAWRFAPDAGLKLLNLLLFALEQGEIRLGGGKTRGLGLVTLDKDTLEVQRHRLRHRDELIKWLARVPVSGTLPDGTELLRPAPSLDVEVHWEPRGPLMVKAGLDGATVDMLPLVSVLGGSAGEAAAVLPGSSIKGALRSHAERVVRTLLALHAPELAAPAPSAFLDQLADPMVPAVAELFGTTGQAGWLAALDVYQTGHTIPLHDYLAERFDGWGRRQVHVAIDRFTGGAADGALYSVLLPPDRGWEPMRLRLTLPRDPEEPAARPATALLLFALRDLAGGLVPLGFGSRRGMGDVAVAGARLQARGGAGHLPERLDLTEDGRFCTLPDKGRGLASALRDYVVSQARRARQHPADAFGR